MRIRKIAVLIDGGFFVKRLKRLVSPQQCDSAQSVAESARVLCKRHVQKLIGEEDNPQSRWLDHVYRLFYYDASPFDGIAHHPILNQQIQFAKTPEAVFRQELFQELRAKRKFALRLGKVTNEDGWRIKDQKLTKRLLKTRESVPLLDALVVQAGQVITPEQATQIAALAEVWRGVAADDLRLGLRQKGVDMRIGIDIASLTLKHQVDTIVLVTGDSDFVPAAKMARREGVEFIVDPLWQSINADLNEHVDGIVSGFPRPEVSPGENEI